LHAHDRYAHFVDYGDAENFRLELQNLREKLQATQDKQDIGLGKGSTDSPVEPGNDSGSK